MRGTVSIKPKRIGADSDSPDLSKYDVKGEDSSAFAQFDIVAVTSLAGNGSYKQVKRALAGGAGPIGSGRLLVALHAFGGTEQGRVAEWAIEPGVNTAGRAVGDPIFLSASTPGARTPTNPGNGIQVGYVVRVDATDGAYYLCPQAFGGAAAASAASTEIPDPGDAGAIPVLLSGSVALVSAGAETRTLADPTFRGQKLTLYCDTYVGNIVVTAASPINVANNTVMTFGAVSEYITLEAVTVGGALVWQVGSNDGVGLS